MNSQCGMRNGEFGRNAAKPCCAQASAPIQHSAFSTQPFRRAITLIELLITMTIIAIISALIMGTAAAAIENAREKNTQALITKIHTLVMERYSSYETRRIDIRSDLINAANNGFTGANANTSRGQALADLRLLGVRELIKAELPDRWNDVIAARNPIVLSRPPQLAQGYDNFYRATNPSVENQAAECLYMIVMRATGDGEARTLFSKQDIGDEDGDGAPEFLDGWGRPISWLRWPTGLAPTPLMSGDAEGDHDPFDVYRRDMPGVTHPVPSSRTLTYPSQVLNQLDLIRRRTTGAFRIVPLVYSIGPDGEQGFTSKIPSYSADLDPYSAVESPQTIGGEPVGEEGLLPGGVRAGEENKMNDNITNHLIEY